MTPLDILQLLQGGNAGITIGDPGANPSPFAQPQMQMPEPPVQSNGNIADQIQMALGAKQAQNPNMAQNILSQRFSSASNPVANNSSTDIASLIGGLGQNNTSYGDYAQGVVQSALGKPTLGPQFTAQRVSDSLKGLEEVSKASLYMQGGGRNATIQAANAIMSENPGMSFTDAFSIAKSGLGQGVTYNNGQVTPLNGAAGAAGEMAAGKETGTATAKEKTDYTLQSQENLPKVVDSVSTASQQIDNLIKSPGLNYITGAYSLAPIVPGTPQADASARLNQIKGGTFLQAFSTLRGGGQISNVEGDKATAAIGRLERSQDPEVMRQSLTELKSILDKGLARAQNAASGKVFNQPAGNQQPADTSGWSIRRVQ